MPLLPTRGSFRGLPWWSVACLLAAAPIAEGAVPNATVGVLRELWEQTAGSQWAWCQWQPDRDPCSPPWGQPYWSDPDSNDGDEAWGLSVCFVCGTVSNTYDLLAINLASNSLSGTIPEALGQLTRLRYLNLNENPLVGTIPASLGNLRALEELWLGTTGLAGGIQALGNLTALTTLGLFNTPLLGAIPDSIGNLTQLVQLYLNNNLLTGPIPESLSNLTALEDLDLSNNFLTGTIPESLGNLTALQSLGLYNNRLNGSIPASFGQLTALEYLGIFNNNLTGTIPDSLGNLLQLTQLGLDRNGLTGTIPESLGNLTALTVLSLNNNRLTGVIPDSLGNLRGLTLLVLNTNLFNGTIPESLGNLVELKQLWLSYNSLTGSIPSSFGNLTVLESLILSNNQLTGVIPESFQSLAVLSVLDLENNNLAGSLLQTPPILVAFQGSLSVNLASNGISYVGSIFGQCTNPNGQLILNLSNNQIGNTFFEFTLASGSRCASSLTLDLRNNSVTAVNFARLAGYTLRYCNVDPCPQRQRMDLTVDLSHNPLEDFTTGGIGSNRYGASYTDLISVDLSNSTRTSGFLAQFLYDFSGIPWNPATGGTLNLSLSGNPGIPLAVVRNLSHAINAPAIVNVDLSWNNYTELASGAFNGSLASSIDLSHNAITAVADDAFDYNGALKSLDLSWNQLSVISIPFLNNFPALGLGFKVDYNALVAFPATNNHIAEDSSLGLQSLQCQSYGPRANNCSCPTGLFISRFSGYVRCTETTTGCSSGVLWNETDGSNAPWSTCINGTVSGQYFSNNAFFPITDCSTFLASTGKQAYEVQAPGINSGGTATSDRLCSLCSTCPTGYHATPCTENSNTKCTQLLSPAAVAAIVLSIVLLLIIGLLGATYGRTQKHQRHQTQTELELTERLLGDVQDEKERAIEEIADMEHAWAITENDLGFGAVIGEGAYGRVFRGTWGHIPVAIKVLRHRLDEMDPSMRVDFDREVKFMRSIRHPHILIFYGAGVDSDSRAFLVTELMAGSLKTVLLNHQTPLTWKTRLTFATDIASGMAYLHDRGTVHRDLKADNCFLDDDNRVKVADFGTGRIAKHIQEGSNSDTTTTEFPSAVESASTGAERERTLSKGVGSLLWMAPEALRGARLRDNQGSALDVYSYAIVLWEIWTRARPWDEIKEEGVHFAPRLTDLVNAGVRPQLPPNCRAAPDGYQVLMEKCWKGRPDLRPAFTSILQTLTEISHDSSA